MGYLGKKCGQFFFIYVGCIFGTKVTVINSVSAIGFLFGPILVPVHILAHGSTFACRFIRTDELIYRSCPAGYFNFYLPKLSNRFNKCSVTIKSIALRKKLIKLLLAKYACYSCFWCYGLYRGLIIVIAFAAET